MNPMYVFIVYLSIWWSMVYGCQVYMASSCVYVLPPRSGHAPNETMDGLFVNLLLKLDWVIHQLLVICLMVLPMIRSGEHVGLHNNFIIHEMLRNSCHLRQISDELHSALLCSEPHLLTLSLYATRESFLSFCRNMQPSGILKVILPWNWPMRCSVLPRNRASLYTVSASCSFTFIHFFGLSHLFFSFLDPYQSVSINFHVSHFK